MNASRQLVALRFSLNLAERMWIDHQARLAGMTVSNWMRQQMGLKMRVSGRFTPAQVAEEEAYSRALVAATGVDPGPFFSTPAPEVQMRPSRGGAAPKVDEYEEAMGPLRERLQAVQGELRAAKREEAVAETHEVPEDAGVLDGPF